MSVCSVSEVKQPSLLKTPRLPSGKDFFFSGVIPNLFYHIKQAKETKRDRLIGNVPFPMELNKIKIWLRRDGNVAQNPFLKMPFK